MVTEYTKPHLTYAEQVAKMFDRGIGCSDPSAALRLVRQIGYYRLSAYVYPFRVMLPPEDRRRETPVHLRSEKIRNGTSLNQVEELWRFDRLLRLICLDGFESIEIGLRTQLAHVLGRRNAFGHLESEALDTDACSRESTSPAGGTNFDLWLARYRKLQQDARNEDYMVHHTAKYGERVPVWIAVEFLDFGAVTRLFSFMLKTDQNEVARQFGVRGGPQFARWLRDFDYLRNICAHHGRLWNRTLTYKSRKFSPQQVDPMLAHAANCEGRDKIYVNLASMAYCLRMLAPQTSWHLDLRRHVERFPVIEGMSPTRNMGFPSNWVDEPLWRART